MIRVGSGLVQAVQLLEGKVNLSSGTFSVYRIIHCGEDGDVEVEWSTGTKATISMAAGQDYAFIGKVTVKSGKFILD